MRDYELIVIVHPDLDETAFNDVVEKVKGLITGAGGSIEKVDFWGKRKLTYAIRKQKEGQYVFFKYQSAPELCATLEHELGLAEPVMRYLISQS
jgi:small subunit ribosomal protein S6